MNILKTYLGEILILVGQIALLYVPPIFGTPYNDFGILLMVFFATFLLGIIMGAMTNKKIKFLFPVVVGILYVPSVFLFYQYPLESLDMALWVFAISMVGLLIGCFCRMLTKIGKKDK